MTVSVSSGATRLTVSDSQRAAGLCVGLWRNALTRTSGIDTVANWLRLEPGVDGLALECEHSEDALVHPGEVLVGYEPVKGLDAESELASGQ